MTVVLSGGQYLQIAAEADYYQVNPLRFVPDITQLLTGDVDRESWRWQLNDPELVYRAQPAVRMVVDYIAGRGSIVPAQAFVRESESKRHLIEKPNVVAQVLDSPFPRTPFSRWLNDIIMDISLWDRWAALIAATPSGDVVLARLNPQAWRWGTADLAQYRTDVITILDQYEVKAPGFIADGGRLGGTSITQTIRDLLVDLTEAGHYRAQVWQRGARLSGIVERPPEEPPGTEWNPVARDRFLQEWKTLWSGDGPEAGGTPVLEDGMKWQSLNAFNAQELQWAEGRNLSLIEACMVFHVAPELIGARPATFANQREHRKAVYQETLGPILQPVADALTYQWARAASGEPDAYIEFNVAKMMTGTLEDEYAAIQTAVGRPWLKLDEARSRQNLDPVGGEEGDAIILPLNVTEGGLASPRDTAPTVPRSGEPPAIPPSPTPTKGEKTAHRPAAYRRIAVRLSADIGEVVRRQRADTLRQLGGTKAAAGGVEWDGDKWERQLHSAILVHTTNVASTAAHGVVSRHGPGYPWDDDPMYEWLDEQAKSAAHDLAVHTGKNVVEALALGDPAAQAIDTLFQYSAGVGADSAALSLTTEAAGYGGISAATALGLAEKTWRNTSTNPREAHAGMEGEKVAIGDVFSNGGRFPGDRSLEPDQRVGCSCVLDFTGQEG